MPARKDHGSRGEKPPSVPTGAQADTNTIAPDEKVKTLPREARGPHPRIENTIEFARDQTSGPSATPKHSTTARSSEPSSAETTSPAMPGHITTRYVKVGDNYHFPNGDPAFVDQGAKLKTTLQNSELIADLVAIAKERGWDTVAISGSKTFRKEAWQQANMAGLTVRGYRETDLERALLARRMGRDREDGREAASPSAPAPSERPAPRSAPAEEPARAPAPRTGQHATPDRVYSGKLVDHGVANYNNDRHTEPSYFVKLATPDGPHMVWGKDLQRALEQSLSKATRGDEVTVRQVGAKPVTVTRPVLDGDGRVIDQTRVVTHLNRWVVETREFLNARQEVAELVRDPSIPPRDAIARQPGLVGTYEELHVAALIARENYPHRADQDRFMNRLREALAGEIERGEPLTPPRFQGRTPGPTNTPRTRDLEREQARVLS